MHSVKCHVFTHFLFSLFDNDTDNNDDVKQCQLTAELNSL